MIAKLCCDCHAQWECDSCQRQSATLLFAKQHGLIQTQNGPSRSWRFHPALTTTVLWGRIMAGTSVRPGEWPANLSRRSFIGAAAATALPMPLSAQQCGAWGIALQQYEKATTAYIRYAEGKLQPGWHALQAGKMTQAAFDALELVGDGLGANVTDRALALLGMPCPDAAAFIIKMEIAYEEMFRDEPQYGEIFEHVLNDVRRVCGALVEAK
jgi:hypothetical protein